MCVCVCVRVCVCVCKEGKSRVFAQEFIVCILNLAKKNVRAVVHAFHQMHGTPGQVHFVKCTAPLNYVLEGSMHIEKKSM